ncbi:site-2 protease family protein [soil metagenome]
MDSRLPPPADRRSCPNVKGSFRIATIAGSEVRIHFTFLLLLGLLVWLAYQDAGSRAASLGLPYESAATSAAITRFFSVIMVFLCVLLHEFGHALAGRYFGIRTPEIVLLPIGGVARLERIPANPFQELIITAAGPAVNVAIAAGCVIFLGTNALSHLFLSIGAPEGNVIRELLVLNLILIAFNIIPAFPMDGGRILRALLATQMNYVTATRAAARVGQGIAVLFMIVGFTPWLGGQYFMLLFIGLFVFIGAQQELVYARIRETVASHEISEILTTRFETLGENMVLRNLPDFLMGSNQAIYPIVDEDLKLFGMADREDLVKAISELAPDTVVTQVARTIPTVTLDQNSTEVLELMQRLAEPVLPVVNTSGQIIGLVEFTRMAQSSPG